MKTFAALVITCFFLNTILAQYKVKFEVNRLSVNHSSDKIFIAGSFNNWDASSKDYFISGESGTGYAEIILPAGSYEYKFTRGAWDKVESTADGKDIENRTLLLQKDTIIKILIHGWKDDFNSIPVIKDHTASAQVKILDSAFTIPQLSRKRRIWIYLPADYNQRNKKYPVIYMHDGQNLFNEATAAFGEWGIDEYLDSLFIAGKNRSIIIGIDNGQDTRMNEYNPYTFQQFGKGEGSEYVDFLVKTLKPYVDKNFNTLAGKKNTFIAGSSMGGLISLYAVLKYPEVFGGAGIFSPAFWTAGDIEKDVTRLGRGIKSRLFFYAGGNEGDKMIADMKRVAQKIRSVSKSNIIEIIDPTATHNEAAWRKYFPYFYQWIKNN